MFFEYAPEISLTFPPQQRGNNSTPRMDVAFLQHDVMIESSDKILPRIREKGEKDRMFEEYLLKMGSGGKTGR